MPHFKCFFLFSKFVERPEKFLRIGNFFLSHNRKSFRLFNTRNCDLKQIVVDVEFSRKKVRFWKVTQHSVVRRDVYRMKDECLWVFIKHLKIHTQNCPHNLDFCLQGVKILRFITLDTENFFFHKMETKIKSLKRGFIFLWNLFNYSFVISIERSTLLENQPYLFHFNLWFLYPFKIFSSFFSWQIPVFNCHRQSNF